MKETMKKFGAWLLAAALAFAGAGAAMAADYTAANQDEFVSVAAEAVSGDRILLGEGKFAIGPVDINGKTLTFVGVSEAKTTVYIGNGGYDGNGGHGSSKTANMTFENLTLDDLASDQGYLTGFTEAAGLTFRKVTFNVGFSNWGNKGGAVSFYDCTFNPVATGKYNIQELRSASGTQYLFDGCVFNSAGGRFINAYKQGGATSNIGIVVKNCTFKNAGSAEKCALNLKDNLGDGCVIELVFVGENKTEGEFPALDDIKKPSKLFATTGSGNATVMLKATDEDDPVVIYANNMKIESTWIDPDGYKPASSAVAKIGTAEYETLEVAIAAAAAGDTVEIVKADTYSFPSLPNNITLSCCDGVIFNCEGLGSISSVPNGCTVIGGTFNMGQNNYHGWQHAGAMVFENSTFNGKFFGYANLTFTGCHFVQTAEDYCMWTYSSPRIDYINCTFDCKGKAVNVYWEQHEGPTEVTADGCTFNSSKENKPALKINSLYGAFVVATTSSNTLSGFPRGISGYDNEPGEGDNAYIVTNAEFDEAGKLIGGDANREFPESIVGQYFAADLATVSNTEGETWKIGVKTEDNTIITTKPQESKVEVPQEVIKDAEVAEKIEQNTKVEGVKLSASADEGKTSGIVAVVEEAKKNTEFAAAVEAAAEVSVKVEVEVKPTEYDNTADKSKVAFKLTPKATVTVVKEEETLKQVVPVTNDMIDQNQKIAVSIYTGFKPAAITHDDDTGARIELFEGDQIAYNEATGVATVLISHFSTLTGFGDAADVPPEKAPAVAKIGTEEYGTLQAAVNAVKEGETIELLAGTIEEGEITLPNTIKNVTIKGAADHVSILKNTSLAHRTNGKSFDGLTIDGVVFDNGRFLVVEWGNGSIKNLTFTNNIFRNFDDGTSEAAVHLNVNASGAVSGFTFENNVIDGCTGGQKSGIYGAVKGDTTIQNNTINNVAFRPICIQIIDTDGEDDNTVVTGNTFSGSSVGRLQIYGTENETTYAPEGTDGGSFIVNNNIFKDITSQQICCWGINTEKVTTDITSNYYDAEDPKMFWNDFKGGNTFNISETDIAANLPHANHDNFNYYTDLTEDGKIDPDTLVEVKKTAAVAKIGETEYETLAAAFEAAQNGDTVVILNGTHDCTADAAFAKLGTKTVTLKGESQAETILNMGTGNKTGVQTTPGTNLTLEDMTLKFDHSGSAGSPMYDHTFYHPASQTFRNVTIVGQIDIMDDTLFDTCTFTGAVNDKDEYLLWCYGCKAELVNCTFEGSGTKAPIKLYNEGAQCGLDVAKTSFAQVGEKGCAIYSSNDYPNNNVYEITVGESVTIPETAGKGLIRSSSTGLTVINPTKDENGKYTGGTFESEKKFAEEIVALTKTYAGEGFAPVVDPTGKVVVEESKVAKIGDTGVTYPSLQAAIAAAQAGETVTLLGDVTVDAVVSCAKAITIDGAGFTLSASKESWTGNYLLSVTGDGTTVKNLTLDGEGRSFGRGLLEISGGDKLIQGVTMTNANNAVRYAYVPNGKTVTFDNCVFMAKTYGIHFDGNAGGKIVVKDSTVTGFTTVGVDSEFTRCTFTKGESTYSVCQTHANMVISNSEFTDSWTDVSADYCYVGSARAGSVVELSNNKGMGSFIGSEEGSIVVADARKNDEGLYTAGTFYGEPSADVIAPGYEKVAQGTTPETWVVQKKAVAQIGETKYYSFVDAIRTAATADADATTVEILGDCSEDVPGEVFKLKGNVVVTADKPVSVTVNTTAAAPDYTGMLVFLTADSSVRPTLTLAENVTLKVPNTASYIDALYFGYNQGEQVEVVINGRLETYLPYVARDSVMRIAPSGSILCGTENLIMRQFSIVSVDGTGSDWGLDKPQAKFGYVNIQGGTLALTNTFANAGAWINIYNRNTIAGSKPTLILSGTKLDAGSKLSVGDADSSVKMDAASQIITAAVENNGTITIDAIGLADPIKVIDYTGTGTMTLDDYGTVNVTGDEGVSYVAYVEDNDLWVKVPPRVIEVSTTAEAQAALDSAREGDTIVLKAGTYDQLFLRQTKEYSAREPSLDNGSSYPAYYREFKDITIKAADDAAVTVKGITAEAGLFWHSSAPASNQAGMNPTAGFHSYLDIKNLAIEGLKFDVSANSAVVLRDNVITGHEGLYVDGLTINNCSTVNGDETNTGIHFLTGGAGTTDNNFFTTEKKGINNVTVSNCEIKNVFQPISFNNTTALLNNLTVTGNTFTDCGYSNILMLSNKSNTGSFTITDNTVNNIVARFIRSTNASADWTITGNTLVNPLQYEEESGTDVVKISGVPTSATITSSDNSWGEGSLVNGTWIANGDKTKLVAVAEIVVGRVHHVYAILNEAVEEAEEGQTIKLLADLDLTQYDVNKFHRYEIEGVTLDLDGHTITSNNGGVVYDGDNAVIRNGSFVAANNGNYALFVGDGMYTDRVASGIVLEDLLCTGGINVYAAEVTIRQSETGMTRVSGGKDYYAVWGDEGSDVTIENGCYTAPNAGVAVLAGTTGSLKAKGGLYGQQVAEEFVADGFACIDNPDDATRETYPWAVQKKAEEEIEIPVDKSGEAVIPVKVPSEIFEQKPGQEIMGENGQPLPAPTTEKGKQDFLVAKQPNGLKVWQNVAMGVDGNTAENALATISREPTAAEVEKAKEQGKTIDIVINTPISEFDPPTTTGVTVSYKLLRSVNGGVTWMVVAENLETPEFPTWTQDNSQDALISEGDTFWKFQAVFESQAN